MLGGFAMAIISTMHRLCARSGCVRGFFNGALPEKQRGMPEGAGRSPRSVFAGVHFVRRNPTLLGTISLDLFAVLLGGATALLPIFAKDILHTGAVGLGLLRARPSVGGTVGHDLSCWREGPSTGVSACGCSRPSSCSASPR